MRWLGGIGGNKCGGGWFDPYGTTEATYIEQARQTVLAGAKESVLFCYGSLLQETGPANMQVLRPLIPELLQVSEAVTDRKAIGVAAYKPPNSHPEQESRVFDFVGMLGVPLVPCHEFPKDAKAAFFSVHALKDPNLSQDSPKLIARGIPILVTDGLAKRLEGSVPLNAANLRVLPVQSDPKSLLELSQPELHAIRQPLLNPFGHDLKAPNQVALYLYTDGSWVVENFNDQPVTVQLDGVGCESGCDEDGVTTGCKEPMLTAKETPPVRIDFPDWTRERSPVDYANEHLEIRWTHPLANERENRMDGEERTHRRARRPRARNHHRERIWRRSSKRLPAKVADVQQQVEKCVVGQQETVQRHLVRSADTWALPDRRGSRTRKNPARTGVSARVGIGFLPRSIHPGPDAR